MSLADDISDEQAEQLAVLYCDFGQAAIEVDAESESGRRRVNYFRVRAAREFAAEPAASQPSLRLLTNSDRESTPPVPLAGTPAPQASRPDRPDDRIDGGSDHAPDSGPERPGSSETRHGDNPHGGPHLGDVGLRLTVLGWVTLEEGEPPVRRAVIRGTQVRAVLSMLALRRGPVHKYELAEVLWPTTLPHHWEGALRGLITKSRRFLDAGGISGRDVLVGEGGYYELRLPAGVALDRDVATALIAAAEVALTDAWLAEGAAFARRAATILGRRLLAGPDNAWFDQVRAELVRDRLTALELCARADLAAGATELANRAANAALEIDPYRESSYRLLMEAQAAAGSRGEALRTYERCRRMLADDLGVAPAAQTQALYIELLG